MYLPPLLTVDNRAKELDCIFECVREFSTQHMLGWPLWNACELGSLMLVVRLLRMDVRSVYERVRDSVIRPEEALRRLMGAQNVFRLIIDSGAPVSVRKYASVYLSDVSAVIVILHDFLAIQVRVISSM